MKYGIYDEDRGTWLEDTIGLTYEECILIGYKIIGKGKLPAVSQFEMLKFLSENHFDVRPVED
jgi:hypothetical protein